MKLLLHSRSGISGMAVWLPLLLLSITSFGQTTRYVKTAASGDGSSWANASSDLQAIINASASGDRIFVAAGTYKPNRSIINTAVITEGNRNNSFVLKEGVKIYGGFAGTETTPEERDLMNEANSSILSGDLGGNDFENSFTNNTENAYHVVVGFGSLGTAELDGFMIKGGNANGNNGLTFGDYYIERNSGGGMCLAGASPTLRNLVIMGNTASSGGGISLGESSANISNSVFYMNIASTGAGIYASQSGYTLDTVLFNENESSGNGGGLVNTESSDCIIRGCIFTGNKGYNGGAIANQFGSAPKISNTKFFGNQATRAGGAAFELNSNSYFYNIAMYNNYAAVQGGAVATSSGSPIFDNVTISTNNSAKGGALYNDYRSLPLFRNSIVYGNTAGNGANVFNEQATAMPTFKYSIVEGTGSSWTGIGVNGGNNTATNPLFVSTASADYQLQAGSPAINTGNNAFVTYNSDINGVSRIRATTVDKGAFEYQNGNTVTVTPPVAIVPDGSGIVYVKSTATGSGNGSSWANATADLQAAAIAPGALQVWVAGGTFIPSRLPANPAVSDPGNRFAAFTFTNFIQVYGGFAGTETALAQRNLALTANATTLSGDIGVINTATDNTYHVVIIAGATFDGFTISGGYANGGVQSYYNTIAGEVILGTGGGIHTYGGTLSNLTIKNNYGINGGGMFAAGQGTISNSTISTNSAQNGGGVYTWSSRYTFNGVTFSGNSATGAGGGAYSSGMDDIFTNVTFQNNTSNSSGGGLYIDTNSKAKISASLFTGNTASSWGGGIYINEGSPSIWNTTISGNTALTGAGIYNTAYNSVSVPVITNVLISGNTGAAFANSKSAPFITNSTIAGNNASASAPSAGVYNQNGAAPVFRNTIIYGNMAGSTLKNVTNSSSTPVFAFSLVQGSASGWSAIGTDGGNNIDANPQFTGSGSYVLQPGSPAINAGNHLYYASYAAPNISAITTDLAGNIRLSGMPDMGAYEVQQGCDTPLPVAEDQTACSGQNVGILTAEGVNLKWYNTEVGGSPLAASEALVSGTYYVSQSFAACESGRVAVAVTVSTDPVQAYFRDADGDGFGIAQIYVFSCFQPVGYVTNDLDCDDSNASVGACSSTFEPIGIRISQCGTTIGFNTYIYTTEVDFASGYRFRIFDGENTYEIDTPFRAFKLNMLPVYSYDKTYVIDVAVFINGVLSQYGDTCTIYSPNFPITQVKGTQCGATISSFNTYIYANEVPLAQAYRFRVISGGNEEIIETAYKGFKLNMLSAYSYGTTYTVDVALQMDGIWGEYGADCQVTTISLPVTKIKDSQCGAVIAHSNTYVYAVSITGATAYRFRVFDGVSTQTYVSSIKGFKFNQLNTYSPGTTYTIDVAVNVGGSWGDYGAPCNVTLSGSSSRMMAPQNEEEAIMEMSVTAFPNPYTDTFTITGDFYEEGLITVQAYDITGKLLDNITVAPSEIEGIKLGQRYAAGIYNIIVSQGEEQKFLKMIKK